MGAVVPNGNRTVNFCVVGALIVAVGADVCTGAAVVVFVGVAPEFVAVVAEGVVIAADEGATPLDT